jgi:hypothetical protein
MTCMPGFPALLPALPWYGICFSEYIRILKRVVKYRETGKMRNVGCEDGRNSVRVMPIPLDWLVWFQPITACNCGSVGARRSISRLFSSAARRSFPRSCSWNFGMYEK